MRKANLIQTAIWYDTDFLDVSSDAKLVYLLLVTQPDVTHVGIVTLAVARWAKQAALTPRRLQNALADLVDHRFIVIDEATDELLIRTWVKHNLAGSKLETAGQSHFTLVGSPLLRWVLQSEHPHLFGNPPPDTPPHTLSDTPHSERGERDRDRSKVASREDEQARARVNQVWAEYQQRHPRSVLTPARRHTLTQWLDTYQADMLIGAIVGNHLDPHCNGQNDTGTQYHDFELIFRDAKHIERYAGVARNGAPVPPSRSAAGRTIDLIKREAAQLDQGSTP